MHGKGAISMQRSIHQQVAIGMTIGAYRVEQGGEWQPYGILVPVRHSVAHTSHSLFLLATELDLPQAELALYLEQFHQLRARLIALQHPNILPITDMGHHQGLPYLVYPAIPTRSLGQRIAQSGPLDPLTSGRYLDQMAAALEYAHEHAIIHGALTPNRVLIQRDGRLLIAGFGVWPTLRLRDPAVLARSAERFPSDAAPEALLGHNAQMGTDVYLLGATIFQALTGQPVFVGYAASEIADQVLRAPVPSAHAIRATIPPGLDAVLARALAKAPDQRFLRPGIFANAYHHVIAPQNTARVPFAETPLPRQMVSNGVGNGYHAPMAQVPEGAITNKIIGNSAPPAPPPPTVVASEVAYPIPRGQRLWSWFGRGRLLIIVGVSMALVLGGLLVLHRGSSPPLPQASASLSFFDDQGGHSNGLTITTAHLATPPAGSHYVAWLIDNQTEHIQLLGPLTATNGHSPIMVASLI